MFDRTNGGYPDVDARSALTGAMAAFALAGEQVEQLGPGLDVAEAMDKVLSDVDPTSGARSARCSR